MARRQFGWTPAHPRIGGHVAVTRWRFKWQWWISPAQSLVLPPDARAWGMADPEIPSYQWPGQNSRQQNYTQLSPLSGLPPSTPTVVLHPSPHVGKRPPPPKLPHRSLSPPQSGQLRHRFRGRRHGGRGGLRRPGVHQADPNPKPKPNPAEPKPSPIPSPQPETYPTLNPNRDTNPIAHGGSGLGGRWCAGG